MADDITQPDAVVTEEVFAAEVAGDDVLLEDDLTDEVWTTDTSGPSLGARLGAEVAGAFILVLMGVGAALFMGLGNNGTLTVGLAFGVAVVVGATAFGAISGAHFNPAITVGVWMSGRFPGRDVAPYILAQLVGASLAGGALYAITIMNPGIPDASAAQEVMATGANAFGPGVGGGWGVGAALLVEVIATAILVLAVLSSTSVKAVKGFAPFTIGLALAFTLVLTIPVTNGSVNPARSTGIALFAGADPLSQLWVFWLAPIVGAVIVGLLYRAFGSVEDIEVVETFEVVEA